MKYPFLCFFLLSFSFGYSQIKLGPKGGGAAQGKETTVQDSVAPIDLYKIISYKNDTTYVDTTLTIIKDYKFNYLRRDTFGLLPFSNTGQPYNSLSYSRPYQETFPGFAAQVRHYNFMDVEDIDYYYVPTPLTELYFKTVPEQGQQLDALFTTNISDNFNASIAYKGTRALGKYQHNLTSTGNLRMTFNYHTDNEKYNVKAHFVSQDLLNEENGGLTSQAIQQYIAKEPEFEDRSVLEVEFENAENILFGKRFYLDQEYLLTRPKDSVNKITLGHKLNYSYRKFLFRQATAENELFGESFEASNLQDETRLETIMNEGSVEYRNRLLGEIGFRGGITGYDYGYNSVFVKPGDTIGNKLKGNVMHVAASYKKEIGGFSLEADAKLNLSDELSGNYIMASAGYDFNKENSIRFGINQNSSAPNFNFLLYQSDYINYNWQNDFDNVSTQRIFGDFRSERLLNLFGSLEQIQNYTYFSTNEDGFVKPFQSDDAVRYLKIKAEKEFDLGIFGSYNTVMYQNVLEGVGVLNVPEFVTRNSIYYKDFWFDKALYLQTGFTLKYFTEYQMNAYDPVLAEFYVQNDLTLGGYPIVDFFFNAKVDQTRIFFKLEHINDLLDGNNNFSAPGYPYRDFLIRFGLVWNFFM